MSIRTNILLRVYIAFGLIVVLSLAVIGQLYRLQYVQGDKWKQRGNIYSVDGSLLATSVPEYELHMDMIAGKIAEDEVFYSKVDSLAAALANLYPDKTTRDYSRLLREARKEKLRYQLVRRRVTFNELKAIRKFPIFNLGKYGGGLIVEQKNKRILPFKSLAARTIGYNNENVVNRVGLEGAYAKYISGENGKRLMQRIAGGVYVPVNDEDDEEQAKDGADIISTIDVNYQDLAQKVLKKQLDSVQADFGTVVLMEVATGEIRAIANFTRTAEGDYKEKMNYAINASAEPGSTFKLASYLAMIDDKKIDTNSVIDAAHGTFNVMNPRNGRVALKIRDTEDHGGPITAKRALEESSNIAVARFVNRAYGDNPQAFIDKLYSFHLNELNKLQIRGEGKPRVKNTRSEDWNKIQSLWQIAYGYESKLTPLQMLTFYNGVANNGKLIAPLFVREIRRMGNTVERFQARVINPKIASDEAISKVRGMLEGVVLEGTGKLVIKNKLYSVAGKTGTAQIANGKLGYGEKTSHQTSFCGYFPADKPKYSMIVVISNPHYSGSHLAAWVSGPVFRKIADRVYANDLNINQQPAQLKFVGNTNLPKVKHGNVKALKQVYEKLGVKPLYASATTGIDTSAGISFEDVKYKTGTVPAVAGMGLSDALYTLGNAGYKPVVRGAGAVASQSVPAGNVLRKGSKIFIELR
jgi:cell division protein FtsI (penicillin-binding protein 3)